MALERAAAGALRVEARRYPERAEQAVITAAGTVSRMHSPHPAEHVDDVRDTGCRAGRPIEYLLSRSMKESFHR
jgi:hypothetical protein